MDFPTDQPRLDLIESLIRKEARRLKRYPIFWQETEEDLFQDLYVALLEAWRNYDPAKGGVQTFTRCVVRRKALNMLRNRCRRKRPNTVLRVLWQERAWENREDSTSSKEQKQRELARDVQKKCMRLPRHLRHIAELLKERAPYRFSQEASLARHTLRASIAQLRPYFAEFSGTAVPGVDAPGLESPGAGGRGFLGLGRCVCLFH